MEYLLYESYGRDAETISLKIPDVSVIIKRPKILNTHNLIWTLFSFGKFREYQIIDLNGKVLSYAQIMPKIVIFTFMFRNGVNIGPCYTDSDYRGKNLYPYLLTKIMRDHKDQVLYIFCNDLNISSQRGIVKAGFKRTGRIYKTSMGIYKFK